MMDFQKFIEWAFMAILSGGVIWAASFLGKISQSINELNEKVAIILTRSDGHEKQISSLSERVHTLETHPKRR